MELRGALGLWLAQGASLARDAAISRDGIVGWFSSLIVMIMGGVPVGLVHAAHLLVQLLLELLNLRERLLILPPLGAEIIDIIIQITTT
jgi:hypothetical protein